ncbi:MAG: FtsX-like permease family protein [Anaerolineaceae bacterium]|nr:MAG: FtsX-like permease family protein [Anaerolineaceae bacterium]
MARSQTKRMIYAPLPARTSPSAPTNTTNGRPNMIEKLRFYFKHSLNDMRVNAQRTFFALLCIGAGVAAIVSLQTLAVMIEGTLTGNLQEQNLGDISASYEGFTFAGPTFGEEEEEIDERVTPEERNRAIERDREAGFFDALEQTFGGFGVTEERLSQVGLEAMTASLQDEFGDLVDVTFRMRLADFGQVFIGNGPGVNVINEDTGILESNFSPIVTDPAVYPFYAEIVLDDGRTLAEAFVAHNGERHGIVVSRDAARALEAEVGHTLTLDGSNGEFTLLGVVPTDTEIRNLIDGFQYGLFGMYYYIDSAALDTFGDVPLLVDQMFLRVNDVERVEDVSLFMWRNFPYMAQTTTEDLRRQNSEIAENLDTLVTVMGLLGLLLGSVGIINTMQVVVRRRTVEIAVLKTLGLQGNQVTWLFLTQAFIMGVIGSVLGVVLGWLMVFVLRASAEGVLRQGIEFVIAPSAVVNGLIVGTLVTTVFGFLPTLSAGRVRPGVVLRPDDVVMPRAGCFATIITLAGMVIVLAFIAQTILGTQFLIALGVVAGAFVAAGIIFVTLWVLIWLVGRFLPSFGVVDVKLSKRQLLASKRRGAVTLLALVVAVFSLSTITLFADSFSNLLNSLLTDENAQPVIIQSVMPRGNERIEQILRDSEEVTSFSVTRTYSNVQFGGAVRVDGTRLSREQMNAQLPNGQQPFDDFAMGYIGAYTVDQLPDTPIIAGVNLDEAPRGEHIPMVVPETEYTKTGLIAVGDVLIFRVNARELLFEVVGISEYDPFGFSLDTSVASISVAWEAMSETGLQPDDINFSAAIAPEDVNVVRRALSDVPGTFLFDTRNLERLINVLLDQFRAFPTLVAILGLVVGGVVIANSVALATLERRKEIAVMKAVGLQRERVLLMLLLENGLLGLVGGLLGVGTGLLTLIALSTSIALPLDVIPFGVAFLLMSLCIVVAIIAALTTAWGASGEKPLNVLRYE